MLLDIRRAGAHVARTPQEAVAAARALHDEEVAVSLERRTASGTRPGDATVVLEEVREVLAGLGPHAARHTPDVVVLLPALATPLATDVLPAGHARSDAVVLDRARQLCRAARNAGVGITVDTDDRLPADRTLGILRDLRKDFPETGVVIHSALLRAEADCRGLAHEGSRVRLVRGGLVRRQAPGARGGRAVERAHATYASRLQADRSFVRCLAVLMAGEGTPTFATDDAQLLRVARALAGRHARSAGSYEVLVPRRATALRRRLAEDGEAVRVLVRWGSSDAWSAPVDTVLDAVLDTMASGLTGVVDRAVGRFAGRTADLAPLRDLAAGRRRPDPTDRLRRLT